MSEGRIDVHQHIMTPFWAERITIDSVAVDIIADRKRGWIVLSAYIGDIPDGDRAVALTRLLQVNGAPAMAGAALGVPGDGESVVLTDQIRGEGLDARALLGRVVSFLSVISHVQEVLQEAMVERPQAVEVGVEVHPWMRV